MRKADKVIISCAVTGSIHTPTMSTALPITPSEIAEQSIAAAEAGAAIIHLHARDPKDGRPSPSADLFMEFLPRIKQASDVVLNISTGGGLGMTLDQRLEAARRASPEVTSLNMGSMNFGIFGAAEKIAKFKYDWERPYLENPRVLILKHPFTDIENVIRDLGHGHGVRFKFECYDVSFLYNFSYFVDRKLVQPPFLIQCIFGILGGIGADPENLSH